MATRKANQRTREIATVSTNDLVIEDVADDAFVQTRQGRVAQPNPFQDSIVAAYNSPKAVTVPTDDALKTYSQLNQAAKLNNLGLSVQLQDMSKNVLSRDDLRKGEDGKRAFRGQKVRVLFLARDRRAYTPRKSGE